MDIPTVDKWRFYRLPSGTITLDELGNDGGWYEQFSFTPEQALELYGTLKECVDKQYMSTGLGWDIDFLESKATVDAKSLEEDFLLLFRKHGIRRINAMFRPTFGSPNEKERSKWKRCQCQAVFVGKEQDNECPDCCDR